MNQQQTSLSEYFQKIQATSLQQLFKIQAEQAKKQEKLQPVMQEQKTQEQTQNNILNIPSIRSLHQQNNSNFINSDQMIVAVNPSDLNLQNEQGENENNLQSVLKVERQVKNNLSKIEKKLKFRAKISGIKVSVDYDGTTLYCCSECNSRYSDKSHIERHIQAHLRVRIMHCIIFCIRIYDF